ncbi:MAG TPA: SAM-dependent chlorinase/fluorinase [Candidatus Acidoferrales bacterium]|jgi:S-adenosylmethionine hydrolase|nr:SAM-dependent chlorinase/fluorinase [Candidatus Acidoferrales bacterium]
MQFTRTHLRVAVLLLFAAISFAGCGNRAAPEEESAKKPAGRPTIVFMTDFGTANDAVAICRAVIVGIVPDVRIMDITHQVTPFSIEEGARFLAGVTPYYPAGTVFLGVVDPGVGTSRKAVIVKSKKEQYFVVPDNGLITPVADRDGVEGVREITNPAWMIGDKVSSTFHGRDIFSPAAAHLAAGEDWTLAGPTVDTLVRLRPATATINAKGITGQVMGLDDPFGSLITDIQGDDFKKLGYSLGEKVPVKIEQKLYSFPYGKTFMDVPVGESLLYIDSRGRVGFAVNQGNFSRVYKITPPVSVLIARKKG